MEKSKEIKEVLSTIFGHKNVSVRAGRGTGYGHIDVRVKIDTNDIENFVATRDKAYDVIRTAGIDDRGVTVYIDTPPPV